MLNDRVESSDVDNVRMDGPWPFVTRRVRRLADETWDVWTSRHHRKGFLTQSLANEEEFLRRCLWNPGDLNWWIGVVFAGGSLLFVAGSLVSLFPESTASQPFALGLFFAGSIPFTTAAYLQLFQAANAADPRSLEPRTRRVLFGWRPAEVGWLSSALQFVGTLLFNVSTFDAIWSGPGWVVQDVAVWAPNLAGSVLFLASGQLAYAEVCHAHWGWFPKRLPWWIVAINLLGCIGFLVAAVLAFVPSGPVNEALAMASLAFTLQGAVCFLIGALLLLPEAAAPGAAR